MLGSSKALNRFCWTALVITSALYFFLSNEADNDLFGHLLYGSLILKEMSIPSADIFSYTALDQKWLNHEWLSQAVFAALWQAGGNPALLLFKCSVACAGLWLLFAVARKRSGDLPIAAAAAVILAIPVLSRGYSIRPQIFTYSALALVLFLIERRSEKNERLSRALPLVFLPWANLHGGFVAGLGTIGLWCVLQSIWQRKVFPRDLFILFLCFAATLANPLGFNIYTFILMELGAHHPISEWQPISLDFEHAPFLILLTVTFLSLPVALRLKPKPIWDLSLLLITAFMAVRHQRHTPLFAIVAVGPLAMQISLFLRTLRLRGYEAKSSDSFRFILATAVTAFASLQVVFIYRQVARQGLEITYNPAEYPWRAAEKLRTLSGIFSINAAVPLEWGEYLSWELYPTVKVSIDGRFAALYPHNIVTDSFELFYGTSVDNSLITKFPTDVVVVPIDAICAPCSNGQWRLIFQDATTRVFVNLNSVALQKLTSSSGEMKKPTGIFTASGGYTYIKESVE